MYSATKAEIVATRKYKDYLNCLNGQTLNEYFDIPFPKFELTQCLNTEYMLTISHIQQYNEIIKLNLPEEIIKYIKKYVEIGFVCKYKIYFTENTPFRAPKWSIISNKSLNIVDDNKLWEMLVNKHNIDYTYDWTPAISMEKDILYFIERLIYNLHKININT